MAKLSEHQTTSNIFTRIPKPPLKISLFDFLK